MTTYTQRAFAARLAELLSVSEESVRAKLKRLKRQGKFTPLEDNGERKGDVYTDEQIQVAVELLSKKKSSSADELSLFNFTDTNDNQDARAVDDEIADIDLPKSEPLICTVETELEIGKETATLNDTPKSANVCIFDSAESLSEKPLTELADEIRLDVEKGDNCFQQGLIHYVNAGKKLLVAKSRIKHGQWKQWLADNINVKYRTVVNWMALAERFGNAENMQTFALLGYSNCLELLALPTGEEKNFIDEQADSGQPVEKLSAREVHEAVKQWNRRKKPAANPDNLFSSKKEKLLADVRNFILHAVNTHDDDMLSSLHLSLTELIRLIDDAKN